MDGEGTTTTGRPHAGGLEIGGDVGCLDGEDDMMT